ncbi:hypothetical protein BU25DRAFT_169767 [Macroventuria anomochaeta]|uniref:Uncharacterized protein n=1 Tax=Macroventuria anomochaeta TaxID=301207 RepID=A0ACB6RSG9_9PLEO|nr:uncharacterized protein BU25DRAFT_169767 [Macroventuria anomochaeta]KAF2623874.1 hypothetical protein BU25DRAFT_169767 [Macroventuria anomochaeta]
MSVVSKSDDRMDYGIPKLSQEDKITTYPIDWTPPVDIHLDSLQNDACFTHQTRSGPLTTEERIQGAIHRLSAIKEAQPDKPDSLSSSSSASTAGEWSTPPTPTTSPSFPQQFSTTLPFYNPVPYTPPRVSQRGVGAQPRTTNPKLAKVRPSYRASALRSEVRYDSITQLDGTPESSAQDPSRAEDSTLNPEDDRITSDPTGSPSNFRHGPSGIIPHSALPTGYYPSLAVQACIRMPNRPTRSIRAAEEEYRFPPRATFIKEGIACSSSPCTAPNSRYNTPVDTPFVTPFATPPDSSANSRAPSLRNFRHNGRVWAEMEIDTDCDERSVDSLTTHVGGTRPTGAQVPRAHAHPGGTHNMSDIRTGIPFWNHVNAKKIAKETRDWEKRAGDAQLPSRSYSIDSETTKASPRKLRALIRMLEKIFWRLKIKSVSQTSPPPTDWS